MDLTIELIAVALALCAYLYYSWKKQTSFFRDRGIPYIEPTWPIGSDVKGSLLLKHAAHTLTDMYNELEPHKVGGLFRGTSPMVVVRDPEYVQRIYTTDFSHFVDRFGGNEFKSHPLEQHLFLLTGNEWRYMRGKLSPVFTSGKLKWMSDEMKKCAELFVNHLAKTVPNGTDVNLKDECAGFTIQVIGSCAFGVETDSIENPEGKFRKFAKEAFPTNLKAIAYQILRAYSPKLFKFLKLQAIPVNVDKFVMDLVTQSFKHRKTTGFKRNDFIQLLLELKEKGSVDLDSLEKDEHEEVASDNDHESHHVMELDDGILAAQLFVFLVAGFETTASTINHLIYLFSQNKDCQEKARQEVLAALKKHGDYTYDMTKDLTYLGDCIDETLRLFPPLVFNFRMCTKDYTFPNGIKIDKGTGLMLPTYPLQHDPRLFPEPEKFIPGRAQTSEKGSYAPFGDGPRVCIGKRFALLEIKLAFARILTSFQLNPSTQKVVVEFKPASFLLSNKMGFPVQLQKLKV